MRLRRLSIRGFRNLADRDLDFPPQGVVLLGSNGQGKTNLLEAIYYPVLFRSLRGALDRELVQFGAPGFRTVARFEHAGRNREAGAGFVLAGRKKRLEIDGAEVGRVAEAAGEWLAVGFLPTDVVLGSGPAAVRRHYLDRTLALADRDYLRALARYRAALTQRNAALRQGRADLARAFDAPLAAAGARIVAGRIGWVQAIQSEFASFMEALGAGEPVSIGYRGTGELAQAAEWPAALERSLGADRTRGVTTIGPHRDDLVLGVNGRSLRDFGSTGQQRTAAIALKLVELATLRRRSAQPALLLDDVFAELDSDRQRRLAGLLLEGHQGQVFLTSPRAEELPGNLQLPVWWVEGGMVRSER